MEFPDAEVVAVRSPRHGGIDLASADAPQVLRDKVRIDAPEEAVLIHAAAHVEWDTRDALLANVSMALNTGTWARSAAIGFSVLVSTVNVYPNVARAAVDTPCQPLTLYGVGKVAAEHVWRRILPDERRSIVRLAGIWGWQQSPTLFWNSLLIAAARGPGAVGAPIVRRRRSFRNYVPAGAAAECLLGVGANRLKGLFLAAGDEPMDTGSYVELLERLPGSRLSVTWQDDDERDEQIYTPSPELSPWLASPASALPATWAHMPEWILGSA